MGTIKLVYCLYLNTILFVTGLLGIVLNRKNILVTLMSIELILLSVSLNFITGSVFLDDITGEIFVIFILAIAASESAIALAIIVSICKYRESVENTLLKKTKYSQFNHSKMQTLPYKTN
jgi:NADH-quinone oxidoreductase subunit K